MKPFFLSLALLLGAGIAASHAQTPAAEPTPAGAPAPLYDVRGIVDPDLGGIVVFAAKVPHGWGLQQSVTRQPTGGTMPNLCIYTRLDSPDGHTIIEMLPDSSFHYETTPGMQQLAAQMAASGHPAPSHIAPLTPVEYLTKIILPRYARQCGLQYRITEQHDQPMPNGNGTASGSVVCEMSDGRKISADVRIIYGVQSMQGGALYTWTDSCALVQSSDDLEQAVKYRTEFTKSEVLNPVWQRKMNELFVQGTQENYRRAMERLNENYQRFKNNVRNQEAMRQASNERFWQHWHSSDQTTQAFCDYIGDRVLLENPATGERVRTTNDAEHYYQDSGGALYSSNTPLNGPGLDFQELQQVEVRRYSR